MNSSVLRTVVLVNFIQLSCACSFFQSTVSLAVRLPPAPEHWQAAFPELDFRIVYPIPESGGFEERLIDSRARVAIVLPKILYLPVLAYPNLPDDSPQLPPAGGVYPIDCDPATTIINLSWQQGAVAEVLCRLWNQGVDCSAVNIPRLRGEMNERCQGDPWALDLDRICLQLERQDFRVTDIRSAPRRDLLLEPGPGRWLLESPFRGTVQAEADGSLLLEAVPLGTHYLFDSCGTICYLLYVAEQAVLLKRR